MKSLTKNFTFLMISSLVVLNVFAWSLVFDLKKDNFLEVNFFDVGQGDAIFIVSPKKHQILIDGGSDSIILEKLGKEMPFYDNTLDLIILTHPEKDHLTGLIKVLKRYKVENILWTGAIRHTLEFKEWEKTIKEEGADIKIAQAGQKIKLQEFNPDIFIEILFPFENLKGQEFKNSNNTSIVSRLVFNKISFLFTGDIHKSEEQEIIIRSNPPPTNPLKENGNITFSETNSASPSEEVIPRPWLGLVGGESKFTSLDSDILKIGHHGSKTSSSREFIEKVSPEIAVISVGKNNRYGHPHQEVLDVLENYGIDILRTDQDGDIKIISDGATIKIVMPNAFVFQRKGIDR